ncbi:hypothetical protein [Burkholderia anthinoferrum]|uniref:hypothetical protein n=1 Tax=Burkholderia anthinoferrum TaxID=3090833 RepID=UPI0011B0DA31|nr:hypothetical protein [Burkholderia anthinoferrum]
MLQTVKKGSSLHVVGQSTARIGEAAPFGAPVNPCERPSRKAWRAAVPGGEAGTAAAGERRATRKSYVCEPADSPVRAGTDQE